MICDRRLLLIYRIKPLTLKHNIKKIRRKLFYDFRGCVDTIMVQDILWMLPACVKLILKKVLECNKK